MSHKVRVKIFLDDDTEFGDFIVEDEQHGKHSSKEFAQEVISALLFGSSVSPFSMRDTYSSESDGCTHYDSERDLTKEQRRRLAQDQQLLADFIKAAHDVEGDLKKKS